MSRANFASESIWTGDNLAVMRGMNSECVDLIYLDPPFNSNRTYEAPIGSKAAGASFKDAWTLDDVDVHEHGELADRNPAAYSVIEAARQAHGKGMQSYLIFMAVRLMEMRRVLKDTGSIYLHCDPTASHYLKLLMDSIFSGGGQMRNEIIWCYRGPGSPKMRQFNRKHDVIFWYSVGRAWTFNADAVRLEHHSKTRANYKEGLKGSGHADTPLRTGKVPESWWAEEKGNGLAITAKQKNQYVGYPTQKPLALLDRIIRASSNPGDMVLDPFCGCATALVAADRLGRQWAGIDLSPLAIKLVDERIAEDRGKLFAGAIALDDPPVRTDMGELPNYRTHRHRLYGEQEGVCAGCDTHFPFRVMDVDHILPRSRGGTDHADNLQLLCSGCNRSKGSKTMAEWRATQ
ncbi:MAG: DNA methyltransferase [Gammaproteobacteria bacterium]|nr:DNA methyltransferase [Gammaproteobacteria bacterium]